jgi:cyclopropane fatty-acyl-phospholipid synthase-like methyltransferase
MSTQHEPQLEFVGEMYDKIAELSQDMLGDSHHFGYFPDGTHHGTTMQQAADRMTDLCVDRLTVAPGQRVLDLGCGSGRPAVRLAEAAQAEVVGITVSSAQLEIAQKRAHDEGLADRVQFSFVDAMSMAFEDESFDAVLAIESLEHMPDQAHVLRSVACILRPGGRLVVAQPAMHRTNDDRHDDLLRGLYRMYGLPEQPFLDQYPQLFAHAGLRVRYLEDVYERVMPPTLNLMNEWLRTHTTRLSEFGDYAEEVEGLVAGMDQFAKVPGAGFAIFAAVKE